MNKRKPLLFTVGALSLIGIVSFGYLQVAGESDGTISMPVSAIAASSDNDQPVTVSDRYAEFAYPTDYHQIASDPAALPVLLRHVYISQENTHAQLAIQITKLQTSSLNDDGSYNFRNTTSTRFHKVQLNYGQNHAIIFTDTSADGYSKVAYLQNNTIAVSIALTSAMPAENTELNQEFASVLSSWQWR